MSSVSLHTKQFQKLLKSMKVDGFWVTHIPDLFYIAGYGSEACWGLIGPKSAAMMVPGLAVDQARALAPGYTISQLTKSGEAFKGLVEYCLGQGWKTVGYDPYNVSDAYMTMMKKATNGRLTWTPIRVPAEPLRIKKDKLEIAAMREAGHITALGFKHVMKITKPGMRETDVAAEFEYFIKMRGAQRVAYDSIVASGPNAAYPHHHTGDRKLRKNDMILCDMAALVDGYCSDLTRTWFLGSISDDGRKIYDAVARAQKLSLAAVKPGVQAAQIDRISRDEIERAGYGRRFIHSTGHGVGVEIHEAPWITTASTNVLESGMVLTVEPGIYVEGWGGVRIEDTVLVTKTGYDVFTK
jgi:Xaa-Pro aminopeptidase